MPSSKIGTEDRAKIAVLVVSCDNYSDLWSPFFTLFRRFWPDCQYPVFLLSNNQNAKFPEVINVSIGDDISWSDNLLKGLLKINEEYVLMCIDDLFLSEPINNNKVMRICDDFIRINGNYLRLNPSVRADVPFNDHFGIVSKGTIYRTSTVYSLWKKAVLIDLLEAGENPWEFEVYGTVRSDKYDGFYSAWETLIPNINGVIKGKWRSYAVQKLCSLGVSIDLEKRRRMTFTETCTLNLQIIRSRLLRLVPSSFRRTLKEKILRGKYNYKVTK